MSKIQRTYEPPLLPEGARFTIDRFEDLVLAPGVRGFAVERGGLIWIPLIIAHEEGRGDVGRLLDSLSSRCRIVTVTSDRLEGMLRRRGWTREYGAVEDLAARGSAFETDIWSPPTEKRGR